MIGYWIVIAIMIIAIVAVLLAVNDSPDIGDDEEPGAGFGHPNPKPPDLDSVIEARRPLAPRE